MTITISALRSIPHGTEFHSIHDIAPPAGSTHELFVVLCEIMLSLLLFLLGSFSRVTLQARRQ
jgi:hypothetical protein